VVSIAASIEGAAGGSAGNHARTPAAVQERNAGRTPLQRVARLPRFRKVDYAFTPASPHTYISDGVYLPPGGGRWRWYVELVPGAAHPQLTVQGWNGADLVTERADVPGVCQATACAAIDALLVLLAAKDARDALRRKNREG
jgi:hypothetical protein